MPRTYRRSGWLPALATLVLAGACHSPETADLPLTSGKSDELGERKVHMTFDGVADGWVATRHDSLISYVISAEPRDIEVGGFEYAFDGRDEPWEPGKPLEVSITAPRGDVRLAVRARITGRRPTPIVCHDDWGDRRLFNTIQIDPVKRTITADWTTYTFDKCDVPEGLAAPSDDGYSRRFEFRVFAVPVANAGESLVGEYAFGLKAAMK